MSFDSSRICNDIHAPLYVQDQTVRAERGKLKTPIYSSSNLSTLKNQMIEIFICFRSNDESITQFTGETVAPCTQMLKRLSELHENDYNSGMLLGKVWMFNPETNQKEYVYVMIFICFSNVRSVL